MVNLAMEDSHRERDNLNKNASRGRRSYNYYYWFGLLMFLLSLACYSVTLGTGWAFYQRTVPRDHRALAAAVISTIPIIAVFVYVVFNWNFGGLIKKLREGTPVNQCELVSFISIELVAAILEAIGGIIFLAAIAGANSGSDKTLGIVAGIFGLLSGCSFCGGFCGFYCWLSGER